MTHVVRKPKFFNSYCLICLAQAWQQNMNLEAFHTAMVLFETIITCTWLRISYQNRDLGIRKTSTARDARSSAAVSRVRCSTDDADQTSSVRTLLRLQNAAVGC